MRLMAATVLACGFAAVPLLTAGSAGAGPGTCDGAGCVPYVQHGVSVGKECNAVTRYVFGLDASGNTLVCNGKGAWRTTEPLVGVRTMRAPCDEATPGMAQSPDGIPQSCKYGGWSPDYDAVFY